MKQKLITFVTGFVIYGLLFGILYYFTETKNDVVRSLSAGLYFGILMGLSDVFIYPRVKNYFSKKIKK